MIKMLDFAPYDAYGEPTVKIIDNKAQVKLASDCSWAPEIREFISTLEPLVDKIYALVNAMGATEFYSCNRNGDAFYEDALKKYHPTFVSHAHPYMHHINKDPDKAYGKVIKSAYNDVMHRVELIVEYDPKKLDRKFVEKINNGDLVNVSMGCRVDSDYCSICGNRAKTPAQYCEHLRDKPGLGKLMPDGRKAFAINRDPEFFDISIVTIPADQTARIMAKIARDTSSMGSSVLRATKDPAFSKLASGAETKIQLDDSAASRIMDKITSMVSKFDEAMGSDFPTNILDSIGGMSSNPIEILNGFIKKKIYLRPRETQRIILVSSGKKHIADQLDNEGITLFNDPEKYQKQFDRYGCDMDAVDVAPPHMRDAREMSEPNIKRIIVKMIIPINEKTGEVLKVPVSSNFRELNGEEEISKWHARGIGEALSTYLIVGSLVAAASKAMGMSMTPKMLGSIGLLSAFGGHSLADPITTSLEAINKPVEEMQLLNPRNIDDTERNLLRALQNLNMREAMHKTGGFLTDLKNLTPKSVLAVPLSFGVSKMVSDESQKRDLIDAQYTGKYNPSIFSRPEISMPLALGLMLKFGQAQSKAKSYIKTANAYGNKLFVDKTRLLKEVEHILFKS